MRGPRWQSKCSFCRPVRREAGLQASRHLPGGWPTSSNIETNEVAPVNPLSSAGDGRHQLRSVWGLAGPRSFW